MHPTRRFHPSKLMPTLFGISIALLSLAGCKGGLPPGVAPTFPMQLPFASPTPITSEAPARTNVLPPSEFPAQTHWPTAIPTPTVFSPWFPAEVPFVSKEPTPLATPGVDRNTFHLKDWSESAALELVDAMIQYAIDDNFPSPAGQQRINYQNDQRPIQLAVQEALHRYPATTAREKLDWRLAFIGYLQSKGLIDVTVQADSASNLIPMLIFIIVSGLAVWVIQTNGERNLLQIQSSESELQTSYEMTLYGWAKALEYRDKETEGHSKRVVNLSQKLARALNCSEEEVQNIRWGAILHDIGKMGVPDSILLKPGALDASEWEIMHQHTKFAKDMLEGINFLQPAMDVIYSHHERWDGAGYPKGLKGEDIPLAARIFAVVDNWDALSSDRPYRRAWPPEKVIEYIRQNAGTMFDPKVVDVFLKMEKS